jgi:hypothetical protein
MYWCQRDSVFARIIEGRRVGACSFGAQWLFKKMTGRERRRLDVLHMMTVKDRLRVIAARFAFNFGAIATFALGGLGPLLGLDWDPARREMVLSVLTVCVVVWAAVAAGDLLMAPNDERFRIIPMDTVAARFWCRRLTLFTGWFALVWVIPPTGEEGFRLIAMADAVQRTLRLS